VICNDQWFADLFQQRKGATLLGAPFSFWTATAGCIRVG
jgi:hypothetical protein